MQSTPSLLPTGATPCVLFGAFLGINVILSAGKFYDQREGYSEVALQSTFSGALQQGPKAKWCLRP